MKNNKEADLRGIGFISKTDNFTGGENKAVSISDYNGELEPIQSIIQRLFQRPKPKTIRFDWKRQKPGRIKAI